MQSLARLGRVTLLVCSAGPPHRRVTFPAPELRREHRTGELEGPHCSQGSLPSLALRGQNSVLLFSQSVVFPFGGEFVVVHLLYVGEGDLQHRPGNYETPAVLLEGAGSEKLLNDLS